jgi:RHS repeat-associated protein
VRRRLASACQQSARGRVPTPPGAACVRAVALLSDIPGYDFAGRLETLTTSTGSYSFGYSASTVQLTSLSAPGGSTLTYSYDGFLPTAVSWSGPVSGSVGVSYDNNFWVTQQTVNGTSAVTFNYDNDGRMTSAGALALNRDPVNGNLRSTELGGVTTRQGYNAFGKLSGDSAWVNDALVFARTYERDDLGRITIVVDFSDGLPTVWGYGYDAASRLQTVTRDGAAYASYEYDANGNRSSRTSPLGVEAAAYDPQDRLLEYAGAGYGFTANGELALKVEGADSTRYDYDVFDNLLRVDLPHGTVIEYVIDGRNRRVGKRVNGVLVQGFLYGDQLNPVAELDGAGNVVARFVYGSKTNVPDYMVRGGETFRILSDHLGSVRIVVNTGTGAVVQRISYDAWGRVLEDTNPGWQPFGFAGGIWEAKTGLLRFGVRDYQPFAGRWTARDPIGLAGGLNVYEYARSNPDGAFDPTGLCPEKCDFSDRFRYNLSETNRFFFSDITRLTRTGIGILTASAVAKRIGGVTFLEFVRTLPGGYPALGGLSGTASAMVINSVVNAALVGLALETGIIIGSALDAAFCALLGGT